MRVQLPRKMRNVTLEWPLRHRPNTSQLQLIEGKIEGSRSRGRQRTTWITDLTNSTEVKYYQPNRACLLKIDKMAWFGSQHCSRDDTSANTISILL